jgi:hypothetical protein
VQLIAAVRSWNSCEQLIAALAFYQFKQETIFSRPCGSSGDIFLASPHYYGFYFSYPAYHYRGYNFLISLP